ncbi:helix-turn-helix domain-containing protein [Rhodovibrionaceae bacterium A322]
MTPFGEKLRALRQEHNLSLKEMAQKLNVSAPYLSALEHGHRGRPNRRFVHQICQLFGIIWDDAEELQRSADLSHPKVTVDTSGLSAQATLLSNLLARNIGDLTEDQVSDLLSLLESQIAAD